MCRSLLSHGDKILLKVSFIGLIYSLFGCSSPRTEQLVHQTVLSADVAPGAVLIDVLESGQPEHYYQYQVQPAAGLVRVVREERFQNYKHEDMPSDFQQPTGAIETCAKNPQATSPNGEYLAYCSGEGSDEFYVADKKSSQTLHRWKPEKGIRGFAWAPNSNSVSILTVSGYTGMHPLELLSLLSGHPVPHDTIFLSVLNSRTGKVTEYLVRRNVPSSFARILNWSE
jgi:hypothetical protein